MLDALKPGKDHHFDYFFIEIKQTNDIWSEIRYFLQYETIMLIDRQVES